MEARDAEVEDLHEVRVVGAVDEHDVLGLHVAVHDPLRVTLARGVAQPHRDMERARQGYGSPGRGKRALEGHAVEVLHHDVHRAVGQLADEKNVHDVRVRQTRCDLCLAVESRDNRWIGGEFAVQDLHGDVAVDPLLKRAVNAPHGADTDELPYLDMPEDFAAHVGVCSGGRCDRAGGRRQRGSVERAVERVRGITGAARGTRFGGGACGLSRALDVHALMLPARGGAHQRGGRKTSP